MPAKVVSPITQGHTRVKCVDLYTLSEGSAQLCTEGCFIVEFDIEDFLFPFLSNMYPFTVPTALYCLSSFLSVSVLFLLVTPKLIEPSSNVQDKYN